MQNVSLKGMVDEELGIRNHSSKSPRSHRTVEYSGLRFLALTNTRHFFTVSQANHM
jgi:hypothetical protein